MFAANDALLLPGGIVACDGAAPAGELTSDIVVAYTTALPPPKVRNLPGAIGANWPARTAALRSVRARAVASGASTRVSHANPEATRPASSPTDR